MGTVARQRPLEWHKSRRCDTAACVEVAAADGSIWVRSGAGSMLAFSEDAWRAFLLETRKSKLTKAC